MDRYINYLFLIALLMYRSVYLLCCSLTEDTARDRLADLYPLRVAHCCRILLRAQSLPASRIKSVSHYLVEVVVKFKQDVNSEGRSWKKVYCFQRQILVDCKTVSIRILRILMSPDPDANFVGKLKDPATLCRNFNAF